MTIRLIDVRGSAAFVAVTTTVLGFLAALLIGATPAVILFDYIYEPPFERADQLLGGFGILLTSVILLYAIRRNDANSPWKGLGLRWDWQSLAGLPIGLFLAAVTITIITVVAVEFGPVEWRPVEDIRTELALQTVLISIVAILLVEAVPEELWFRGYLYDTLLENQSQFAIIVITSVAFGSLHVLSQPPTGIEQRILWVIMATALGFVLVVTRIASGAIWMPVGFHLGHNLVMFRLIDVRNLEHASFIVLGVVWIGVLLLVGGMLLQLHRSRAFNVQLGTERPD
jgi:uncharacterized protein